MKKKIILAVIGGIFAIFSILSFSLPLSVSREISLKNIEVMSKANAQVNPNCPTGCVEGGPWCYCNGMSSTCWNPPKGSTLD